MSKYDWNSGMLDEEEIASKFPNMRRASVNDGHMTYWTGAPHARSASAVLKEFARGADYTGSVDLTCTLFNSRGEEIDSARETINYESQRAGASAKGSRLDAKLRSLLDKYAKATAADMDEDIAAARRAMADEPSVVMEEVGCTRAQLDAYLASDS